MGEKLVILKDLKNQISSLESLKEKYKEQSNVREYVRNKCTLEYFNNVIDSSDDILSNEEYINAILSIDSLTRADEVKKYINVCENLKLCKNLKCMLLTEYASKQKIKK